MNDQSAFNLFRLTPQRILSDKEIREQEWRLKHTNSITSKNNRNSQKNKINKKNKKCKKPPSLHVFHIFNYFSLVPFLPNVNNAKTGKIYPKPIDNPIDKPSIN